jgi:hypothetical protein
MHDALRRVVQETVALVDSELSGPLTTRQVGNFGLSVGIEHEGTRVY